ncbi:MAG TPA: phosphatidylserine decarboxylase [Thermoplasmatales archaeon]|nr:phosphatidylserine decarboxylase [Thermoplasmatales archaeon]
MIARGCYGIALSPLPFLIIFLILAIFNDNFIILAFIAAIIQSFFLYFFRDADRRIGDGIISPADGKVLYVKGNEIAIFMSIFDMHVNLAPYDGKIEKMIYKKGEHKPAYGDTSKNERMEIYMDTEIGEIVIAQIAGIFARRILPYVKEGQYIKKGEKIGIIKFGSRVELKLPKNCKIVVKKGRKIKAGETIAATNL